MSQDTRRLALAQKIQTFHGLVTARAAKRGAGDFLSGLIDAYATIYGFADNTEAMNDALSVAGRAA